MSSETISSILIAVKRDIKSMVVIIYLQSVKIKRRKYRRTKFFKAQAKIARRELFNRKNPVANENVWSSTDSMGHD